MAYIECVMGVVKAGDGTLMVFNEKLMLAVLVLLITRNNAWSSGTS